MKRIKVHIIQLTAIVISTIYVLAPIHNEVKSILHSISHSLEMPDIVLSHNHHDNLKSKDIKSTDLHHEHEIIDILDYFLAENPHKKDTDKPNVIDISFDKYFHPQKYMALELVSTRHLVYDYYKEKIKEGFYRKIKIPPKKERMQLS